MNAQTETEKIAERRQAGLPPQPVRRQLRRPDRQGQGALLRRRRAHAAGHARRPSTRKGLFPAQDGIFPMPVPREPVHRQGDGEPERGAVPVGPLRPQQQLAAVRRGAATHVRQLGRQHQQVQLDQPESQLGARRVEAERVHLPVRRLQQPHRVALVGAERDLPERRHDRRQHQHAADARSRRSISSATTSPGT